MKQWFINIGWTLIELILFLIALGIIMSILLSLLFLSGFHPIKYLTLTNISESTNPYPLLWINYLPALIALITSSIVVHHILFKRTITSLGYVKSRSAGLFGKGWALSSLMIIPGFLILWLGQQIRLLDPSWHWSFVFGFLLFFIIQSAGEEILTRAFLIPMLEYRLGTRIALILSASSFAILHIANDNFTWLGFFNILLGGSIMALLFVIYRNVMICIGYHAGWNFIQGGLLDFNVSGIDVHSLVQFQDLGYSRITGASFGYEGSLLAVLFQGILLAYILKTYRIIIKKPKHDSPVSESLTASEITLV
ncbi:MAG: CPBP family intramembrane glutamic endopeptidase [Saprospiraceae bacterium]